MARAVTLAELDEDDRNLRFWRLQRRMPAAWAAAADSGGESVVVLPSIASGPTVTRSGSLAQAYEERFLFLLLLLRRPGLRIVYVTSTPVDPRIVEYYLALLPGVVPSDARSRLSMVSVGDGSARPLSAKLLDRPRVLERIAAFIPDRARSHLIPYATTRLERDVALTLGIPVYGAEPALATWGSKSGGRRLFHEVGIAHPAGAEALHGLDDVAEAIERLLAERPGLRYAIVKLDYGVSGSGNALVDLDGIADLPARQRRAAIDERVREMRFDWPETPRERYLSVLASEGGVVEERLAGAEVLSPSVQLQVLPDGTVEVVSTHDQLLGGTSGQSFLGCVFPANPAYSRLIAEPALAIGRRLAAEGVIGRFSVDFIVVPDDAGDWSAYAIEVNLRMGGTTHPFLALQFLTDGRYDAGTGRFLTPSGAEKHLVATDHLESPELRALTIDDLFDAVTRHGLHFDSARETGIVLHMISSVTEHGRVGMTAVGDTPEAAMQLFARARRVLLDEAIAAARPSALPD
ncbi:peptide ligase PGM1-related protein [Agromyces aurantiacus]|uniref:Peptide ligase PGM1-related protein n=1 Tax=Agromyces aurantiacus TaxID=165814 RepID=A0ABV9R0T5_9MICO|nr:peptide ligase PGM1-related protein [Agromyces aurantiacus]MBM7506020.1 hypothetical protein [Agromyces aurantiacus]